MLSLFLFQGTSRENGSFESLDQQQALSESAWEDLLVLSLLLGEVLPFTALIGKEQLFIVFLHHLSLGNGSSQVLLPPLTHKLSQGASGGVWEHPNSKVPQKLRALMDALPSTELESPCGSKT